MKTLVELWDDTEIPEPFIAKSLQDVYFLCQERLWGDYFLGQVLELRDYGFEVSGRRIFSGTEAIWESIDA